MTGRMQNQECSPTDTAQLASQAWAAYDTNRIRECFALMKTLESADPGNADIKALQNAIRNDIERDLDDARALLDQAATSEDGKKYRKAAEIVLTKVLRVDPENDEAKVLLQSMQSASPLPESRVSAPAEARVVEAPAVERPVMPTPEVARPVETFQANHRSQNDYPATEEAPYSDDTYSAPQSHTASREREEIPFTAATGLFDSLEKNKKRSNFKIPYGIIAFVLVVAGAFFVMQSRRTKSTVVEPASQPDTSNRQSFQPRDTKPAPPPPVVPAPSNTTTPVPQATPAAAAVPPAIDPATQATTGKLAVSSPTAAEIYIANKYVGSTPTTLQLPVGRQTVEYRHDELKTVVTHDIKANATTTASVTFPITVQVNAKPWAQVFLEGTPRRALGQTPLGGVTVPIGGVLVFENPNFASKTYRVTDKDTAVQVDFQ